MTGDGRAVHAEVCEGGARHGIHNGRHDIACLASLDLKHPGLRVGACHIKAGGVGLRPGQEFAIGEDIPETVFAQVHQDTVHEDAPWWLQAMA